MKRRAITLFAILATTAMAGQDTVKLERAYKTGEADNYKVLLVLTMSGFGEVSVDFNLTQTVNRVHDNGDADITSKSSNTVLKLNGQPMTSDAIGGGGDATPTTQRFDKYSRPVSVPGATPARGLMNQFNFMRYGLLLAGQEIKVGETVPVTYDDKETKTTISGTAKLVSVTGGIAKIESAVKISTPETLRKPIDLTMTSQIDVATAKPIAVGGEMTQIPPRDGMAIDKIRFSLNKG